MAGNASQFDSKAECSEGLEEMHKQEIQGPVPTRSMADIISVVGASLKANMLLQANGSTETGTLATNTFRRSNPDIIGK